jgi:thioredoxin
MVRIASVPDYERLSAAGAMVVLFWAAWCVPSRTAHANLEALERRYQGRLSLGAVEVDGHEELSARHDVKGLPTLLVLQAGVVRARRVGLMSRDALERLLDRHA